MKTNISQYIKSEVSERTLKPSENAWEKLSKMLDEEKPKGRTITFSKWKIFAVAASFTVLFTALGFILIEQPAVENTIQVAGSEKNSGQSEVKNPEVISEKIYQEEIQLNSNPNSKKAEIRLAENSIKTGVQKESIQNTEHNQTVQLQQKTEEPVAEFTEIKKQNEIVAVTNPEPESKPEKKNYVDSDMLLYSVESNQAISESKSNTRLVIIDFNK